MAHLKRKRNRSSGVLVLFLFMWVPFLLKTAVSWSGADPSCCVDTIYVQIQGDVPYPGVYPVEMRADGMMMFDQRVDSLMQELFPRNAKPCTIRSGIKWTFQRKGDGWHYLAGEMSAFHKCTLGIPIAINQEPEEGLTAISGIGPQLAKAIVQERTRRGGFHNLDELKSVRGIGTGLLKRIAPFITF